MKKLKISFHNHTSFSDGSNSTREMAQAAYRSGFTHFAFTDHHTIPGELWTLHPEEHKAYVDEIEAVKEEYSGRMIVYSGIEADWFDGSTAKGSGYEELCEKVDIIVGSVHTLTGNSQRYFIDGDKDEYMRLLNRCFDGDAEAMLKEYFKRYCEMVRKLKPTLVGHPDIIRMNNAFLNIFSEESELYRSLETDFADTMAECGAVTEVNAGGDYRYANGVIYPSDRMLKLLCERNVKVTVGLDAHSTDMLTAYYEKTIEKIAEAGYRDIAVYENGKWENYPLNEFD